MKYTVFVKIYDRCYKERQGEQYPCIRVNVEEFDTLDEAKIWCHKKALNSDYSLSDFRIFVEFPVRYSLEEDSKNE